MERRELDELLRWVDAIYEGRDGARLSKDEAMGRIQQAPISGRAKNLMTQLPPGPYSREQLKRLVEEWAGRQE